MVAFESNFARWVYGQSQKPGKWLVIQFLTSIEPVIVSFEHISHFVLVSLSLTLSR